MSLYFLFESAAGFALFAKQEFDEVSATLPQVQKAITSMDSLSKMVRLEAFHPFKNTEKALENAFAMNEGKITEELKEFLESHCPVSKSGKQKNSIAISDVKIGKGISDETGIPCKNTDVIMEIFRGIRQHFTKFLKNEDFKESDLGRAQLGLGHAFSRRRVATDVNRQDKHILQSSALLELLDKNLNTFCMRIKEWYGWHFPELAKIVTDNTVYVKVVNLLGDRKEHGEEILESLEELVQDGEIAQRIVAASAASMGQDIGEIDLAAVKELSSRILSQCEYRDQLQDYMKERMLAVAPNLTALVGENVGAKLIAKAGSLVTLAKYPASTIQILGAEKALFRALKTRGNTPKYGLLYNSTYISRAATKNKGKISRYLANKCSLASRIDHFLVEPTTRFGEEMKTQVEDRLKFLDDGQPTKKNQEVMSQVLAELQEEGLYRETEKKKKKKKKKVSAQELEEAVVEEPKKKKKKVKGEDD